MLNQNKKLVVFQSQTENVRELQATWEHIKRSIHEDLVNGNNASAAALTRLLALTYCAWTEALFSKLIHTPYGFDLVEIDTIKKEASKTVVLGWKKCVALALNKVPSTSSSQMTLATTTLANLVKTYIEDPSQLRNKIAHGQVVIALNSANEAVNQKLTTNIANLDIVELDRLRAGALALADIVEMLIESPIKNGMSNFQEVTQAITQDLARRSTFTLAQKINLLKKKRSYFPKQPKCNCTQNQAANQATPTPASSVI